MSRFVRYALASMLSGLVAASSSAAPPGTPCFQGNTTADCWVTQSETDGIVTARFNLPGYVVATINGQNFTMVVSPAGMSVDGLEFRRTGSRTFDLYDAGVLKLRSLSPDTASMKALVGYLNGNGQGTRRVPIYQPPPASHLYEELSRFFEKDDSGRQKCNDATARLAAAYAALAAISITCATTCAATTPISAACAACTASMVAAMQKVLDETQKVKEACNAF